MTVTYSLDVSSSTFCGIHKLLFRWKGSIWKSIWPELLLWLCCYAALSILYRFALSKTQQIQFEDLCVFFYTYGDYIPLTFLLGFYVNAVFGRWSEIFNNLGWIDSPALLISTYVKGDDETARKIRRNIIRYMVLTQAMVFRDVSMSVKRRFPTMDHLVTAGLMTENELKEFDSIVSPQLKYWVPMNWVFCLIRKARELSMIESDIIYTDLLEKLRQYRVNVLTLTLFDWVPIPLVYTQVVNLAVRSYFIVALMGRQYLIGERDIPNAKTVDLYVPIMSILQFLFYIGWMKVAEVMINPLGDDDDDFECNWVLDRNLQVGLSIVDDAYGRVPELEKDMFWNDVLPEPLYTAQSASRPHNPMIGSCNDLQLKKDPYCVQKLQHLRMPWHSEQNLIGFGERHNSSDEAMILQPRRRRFMSVTTVDSNKLINPLANEIPVPEHNPMRRSSCIDENGTTDRQNRLLDSFRRKLSKQNRRGAKISFPVHPSHPGLKGSGDFSDSYISAYNEWYERNGMSPNPPPKLEPMKTSEVGSRWNSTLSRNSSVCSSNFIDGLHTPFAQSLPAHLLSHHHHRASDGALANLDPQTLNSILDHIAKTNEENQSNNDTQKGIPPSTPNASWTVNEMLPVIQEEDQMSRKMTQHSMNGSTSNNSDNDNNHKTSQTTLSSGTTASIGDIRMSQDGLDGTEAPNSIQKVKNVLQKAEDEISNSSNDDFESHHPTVTFENPLPSQATAPAELAAEEIDRSHSGAAENAPASIQKSRTFGGLERPKFRLASESEDNTP
uniref:Bestrophin homolog n=1 Tax=Panagrolaimus sp. PS1159 TaxID=55785 RepID=A0AC35FE08_9BILA